MLFLWNFSMNIAVILQSNLQQNSQNVDIYYARYVSLRLWNQLPTSLRQLHPSLSISDLPVHAPTTSSHSVNSPLSPSITPSLFHSRLKTYLFHKSFPSQTHNWSLVQVCLTICLWNQLPSSLRQPHSSPSVSVHAPATSYSQLTTLTNHNSLSLSLPPQNLPLSQIFPIIDSLLASGLAPGTSWLERFFYAPRFLFIFSFLHYSFNYVWFHVADQAGYSSAFGCTIVYRIALDCFVQNIICRWSPEKFMQNLTFFAKHVENFDILLVN